MRRFSRCPCAKVRLASCSSPATRPWPTRGGGGGVRAEQVGPTPQARGRRVERIPVLPAVRGGGWTQRTPERSGAGAVRGRGPRRPSRWAWDSSSRKFRWRSQCRLSISRWQRMSLPRYSLLAAVTDVGGGEPAGVMRARRVAAVSGVRSGRARSVSAATGAMSALPAASSSGTSVAGGSDPPPQRPKYQAWSNAPGPPPATAQLK